MRLSLTILGLAPFVSFAADVGGGIRVGASYTDNLFLGPSSNEIDEVVYQASPWLRFIHESPKLDANAEYTLDWYRYSDLRSTSSFHRGEAKITGRTWEDSLTTELGARRTQVLSDPNSVIPSGSLPISGNLVDLDEWWFDPQLSRSLGSIVNLDARYRYSRLQFDEILAQDNTNHAASFSLENYAAGQGLTWALRYDWRRTEYEFSAPWENQRATAELGAWVNAKTRVFGAGGKESAWDNPFDPALVDPFWEAGFAYKPSESLSAEFAWGERSFGSSWRGQLDFTFRRGSTSLSYNDTPTTTGFDRNRGTFSIIDEDNLDEFLNRPGNAERYISRRFEWDLNLEFRRTGFGLFVFDEGRSNRLRADGTPIIDDQSQTGVRANFTWKAGVRTQLNFSGLLVRQVTSIGNRTEYVSARLGIVYDLGTHSDISLNYSHSEQHPRDNIGVNYVENVVTLFFTYTM